MALFVAHFSYPWVHWSSYTSSNRFYLSKPIRFWVLIWAPGNQHACSWMTWRLKPTSQQSPGWNFTCFVVAFHVFCEARACQCREKSCAKVHSYLDYKDREPKVVLCTGKYQDRDINARDKRARTCLALIGTRHLALSMQMVLSRSSGRLGMFTMWVGVRHSVEAVFGPFQRDPMKPEGFEYIHWNSWAGESLLFKP